MPRSIDLENNKKDEKNFFRAKINDVLENKKLQRKKLRTKPIFLLHKLITPQLKCNQP